MHQGIETDVPARDGNGGNDRRRTFLRVLLGVFVGTLLVQAAWALVVPPFRGLDEHEHAYKAAAVALGDWSPHHEASPLGWGSFVTVPADLVAAAGPVCDGLSYSTRDNCTPVEVKGDGLVSVATVSAAYNPAFYFVIGTAARPFHGTSALEAMRAAAAVLCALFIAAAAATTALWGRTRWPVAAVVLAGTPVMIYSTAVAAPNGLEAASAMLVWCALLGLVRQGPSHPNTRLFVLLATVGGIPLVSLRTLGPLWLVLILLTAAVLLGRSGVGALARLRSTRCAAAVVLVCTAVACWWTLASGANQSGRSPDAGEGSVLVVLPGQLVYWIFQSIAAFPARNELAPMSLYVVAFLAWWVVLAMGLRAARSGERWSMLTVVGFSTVVPVVLTAISYSTIGVAWQGRYGYPYSMGLILICGLVLDRTSVGPRANLFLVGAASSVALSTGLIGLLDTSSRMAEWTADHDVVWAQPPALLVASLACAGVAVTCLSLWPARAKILRQDPGDPTDPDVEPVLPSGIRTSPF